MVVFFWLCLSLLMVHELDATFHHEWRLLPGLSALPDKLGRQLFVLLHIPIFAFTIAFAAQEATAVHPTGFRIGYDGFSIGHLAAHYILRNHPLNTMRGWDSWIPIVGSAICGCIDLYFCFA
jgi:hypothetical protein